MPSLPRGGGEELVRDEQVSSRRVRRCTVCSLFACFPDWKIRSVCVCVCMLVLICMGFIIKILTMAKIVYVFLQRQLEDYLNKLLRMAMYRKYHHTVSNHTKHCKLSYFNITS